MASGISPVLVSSFLAEHARVKLPGIVAPLLVDEPVQPPDWDSGTSREAVERRTSGPSEAAGCWEGSEGEESDEERGDCTPAWSPFPSEAAPAASAWSAAIFLHTRAETTGAAKLPSARARAARLSRQTWGWTGGKRAVSRIFWHRGCVRKDKSREGLI